jgi:hypothetical protein
VLFEKTACARRCRSSWLTGWWTQKRIIGTKCRADEEEGHKGPLSKKTTVGQTNAGQAII